MTVVSIRRCAARLVAAAAGTAVLCCSTPDARAQFGSIFGDPPPRPPASVPGARQQQQPQQQQQQQQQFPDRLPPGPPPSARRPQQQIQSEPLPPPPGSGRQDAAQPPALPPGVRAPRGTPQPANTTPQPGDEVIAAPPTQKIPNQTAVFSGLDKITGRIISFDVALGETVQFGALQVVPRVCYTRPPTEAAATDAFVEVSEVTLQGEVRRIFSGWMFAASPGLNAVEHPIYDVWLTDCKQPTMAVAEQPAPPQLGLQGPPQVIPESDTEDPQGTPQQQQTPRQRPQQAQQPQQQQPAPRPQQAQQPPRPRPQPSGANPFPTPIR